ncbi:MAG: hypothetical protein J6N32_12830 [Clostridia bacterium]|nr:hypothetical protein [Clostridia bacterium]
MKTETKKYLKIGVIALILYLIAQNWLIVAGAFTTVLSAASPLIVGGVMGIPGMLLGVPLAAAAYRLLREDVNREKTGQNTDSTEKNGETICQNTSD